MPCLPLPSRFPRGALLLGTVAVSTSCSGLATRLGGPPPYRAPAVVLAYPARGAALPTDKAVVLFRFAPREAADPVDAASFRATVDGIDRTTQFRVTTNEAWGTLGDTATGGGTAVAGGNPCIWTALVREQRRLGEQAQRALATHENWRGQLPGTAR